MVRYSPLLVPVTMKSVQPFHSSSSQALVLVVSTRVVVLCVPVATPRSPAISNCALAVAYITSAYSCRLYSKNFTFLAALTLGSIAIYGWLPLAVVNICQLPPSVSPLKLPAQYTSTQYVPGVVKSQAALTLRHFSRSSVTVARSSVAVASCAPTLPLLSACSASVTLPVGVPTLRASTETVAAVKPCPVVMVKDVRSALAASGQVLTTWASPPGC